MTLYNFPNITDGIDEALVTTAQEIPAFPIMILLTIFFVTLIGGVSLQQRRFGYGDIPFWGALASISTTIIALLMTIGSGIIDITTLGITIAITIMFNLWFFLSKARGETD